MNYLIQAIEQYNCGQYLKAKTLCEQAILELGDNDLSFGLLATIEKALDNKKAAIKLFQKSLKLNPNNPDVNHNFAGVLADIEPEQALVHSEHAVKLNPHNAAYQERLGYIHWKAGNLPAGLRHSKAALTLNATLIDARITISAILISLKHFDEAHSILQALIREQPEKTEAYINLGKLYREVGERDQALTACQIAVELRPHWPDALFNLGYIQQELGHSKEALETYSKALAIFPEYAEARLNRSVVHLQLGNYSSGWPDYHYRFLCGSNQNNILATPSQKEWHNESLGDLKQLLLVGEQGLGDTLQFMRYIKPLRDRGIETKLCAQTSLHELIRASNLDTSPLTPEQAAGFGDGPWLPLLSLPQHLDVRPDHPIITDPYIKTSDQLISKWQRLLSAEQRPIIGLHWQGNPATEAGLLKGRSMPLETFQPIAARSDLSLLSLQKGFGAEQLKDCSFRHQFVACQEQIEPIWDFLEIAAIVSLCDLVITTDSAVAHLAGGLGKPTWLLLQKVPEWRWGLEGDSTFWYPSMRLFRQTQFDNWEGVIQRVNLELDSFFT